MNTLYWTSAVEEYKWTVEWKINKMTPKTGEVYRHFKGGLYVIRSITRHTETEELMVNYEHLNHAGDDYWKDCCRPLSMWSEEVEYEGKKVPRFTRVTEASYPTGTPY